VTCGFYLSRVARLSRGNATAPTGTPWAYVKVRLSDFKTIHPTHLSNLLSLG